MDQPVPDTYEQAVLQGFASLRPDLLRGLPERVGIPADRIAAALGGTGELSDDEISRLGDLAGLSPSELVGAVTGVEAGEMGESLLRVIASDAECFQAFRAARAARPVRAELVDVTSVRLAR